MSSKGILEGLMEKKETSKEVKKLDIEKLEIKRSFSLKPSTVKKLQELKVFLYEDPNITYNEIVDEAICNLYKKVKKERDLNI